MEETRHVRPSLTHCTTTRRANNKASVCLLCVGSLARSLTRSPGRRRRRLPSFTRSLSALCACVLTLSLISSIFRVSCSIFYRFIVSLLLGGNRSRRDDILYLRQQLKNNRTVDKSSKSTAVTTTTTTTTTTTSGPSW